MCEEQAPPGRPTQLRAVGLAGLAAVLTVLAVLTPPSAAVASPSEVGGPLLDGPGVAVHAGPGVAPLPAGVSARSWLVADLDSGQVLAARDAHSRHRPASTMKTLTALSLLPLIPPDTQITFTADALAQTVQADGRSTRIGLEVGRSYAAGDLFAAMLVVSANDAAEALASAVPGGRAAALQILNDTAHQLRANDTFAGTPDGLDAPDQSISAYDLALLARAALRRPDFSSYDAMPQVHLTGSKGLIGGSNHNRLLVSYPGAYGGKDGYTTAAGQVWWGAAERGGRHLVVAVVDAGARPVNQEMALLDWGFAADGTAAPVGELVAPLPMPARAAVPAQMQGASPLSAAGQNGRAHQGLDSGPGTSWLVVLAGTTVLALYLRRARRIARRRRSRDGSTPRRNPRAVRPS